jgi:hypothetical protein
MRTVGCERPSGLIRDDEGDDGGIGEGVVGESFELGTTSALGAPLSPRDITSSRVNAAVRE